MSELSDTQIDNLFHQALEKHPTDRTSFLRSICGKNEGLRIEVESLIQAHESSNEFLKTSIVDDTLKIESALQVPSRVGTQIGHYRIVDAIASGGMGTVYLAVRADEVYSKKVAIKIIRHTALAGALKPRFHRERQTLAQLEHPYITRLIDGGTLEDGLPYLVMEYVQGKRIDDYCDNNRLSIVKRIKLFRRVCEAVQYSHQNLIVHRDLKPNNILITDDGIPKLLDFGISKLIDEGITDDQADVTVTLFRALTPRYASPEQIHGQPVNTTSDVYSLGVILYELLTGHQPYQLANHPNFEQQRIICEEIPITPSVAVCRREHIISSSDSDHDSTLDWVAHCRGEKPHLLKRNLQGDLDNVVMKAMHKDPHRRYASVLEFSDDLRRYLEKLPVAARKDTLLYRSNKFIKRNKGMVITSTAMVIALIVGIIGTTMGLIETRKAQQQTQMEKNVAVLAEQEAKTVAKFLQDMLTSANPYRTGRDASEIYRLLEEASSRVEREYSHQPAAEAAVRYVIANTHAGLWQWEQAEDQLWRALELNRRIYGNEHRNVADCLILLGRALTFQNKPEAVELQREALNIRQKLFTPHSTEVAWSKTCLGFALWHAAKPPRFSEAEPLLLQALRIQRQNADTHSLELAISLHTLGAMYKGI